MNTFRYIEPKSVAEVVSAIKEDADISIIGGGSDLLSEIKNGTTRPNVLVGLSRIDELKGIAVTDTGVRIGSMVTIDAISSDPIIKKDYRALSEAASGLATPQIRNIGTLGGNLNQRPRCWYYRNPLIDCLKKGGDKCYALGGHTKYLCVTEGERCYIVHPSDTAVALSLFNAGIEIASAVGTKIVPIHSFFVSPSQNILKETILEPDEFVTAVYLPKDSSESRHISKYVKARERQSGDFALVSVGISLKVSSGTIKACSICFGGIAPTPHRSIQMESYLENRSIESVDISYASSLAISDPRPFPDNEYKVTLAKNLSKKALSELFSDL